MAMYIPEAERQPHLFLSHSSIDNPFVTKLANDLNKCEIDVWLDQWEIGPGDSLYDKLSNGIESSKFIALTLTQSFLESKWSSEELKQAIAREKNENVNIILPLLIENIKLPVFLQDRIYIPFADDYYRGLAILAGMLHGLSTRAIYDSLNMKNLKSVNDVVKVLEYCGLNPYMIIPKDVFEEIANAGLGKVYENRMRFNGSIVDNFFDGYELNVEISDRAKDYIIKILGM